MDGGSFTTYEQKNSLYGQDEYLASTFSSQDNAMMEPSQSDLEKLYGSINYAAADLPHNNGAFSQSLTNHGDQINLFNNDYSSGQDFRKDNTYLGSEISSNLHNINIENNDKVTSQTAINDLNRDISSNLLSSYRDIDSADNTLIASTDFGKNPSYYYEKDSVNDLPMPAEIVARKINSDFSYIYRKSRSALGTEDKEILIGSIPKSREIDEQSVGQINPANPFLSALPNLKYVSESPTSFSGSRDQSIIKAQTNNDLNSLIQASLPSNEMLFGINGDLIDKALAKKVISPNENKKFLKNYAIVVGINNYTDRSSLHTSVNDAETMAALLESYGYDVIKLTDNSDEKPTKSNILEKALGEMGYKKDVGKVVIYFSGHGEKKGDKTYLIPQDSNGQVTSYISAEELQKSIKGLKSVALVVDACNSGGLENVVENGQMILVSSKEDQPSNEVWFGSLSLFTYNLCEAMREEGKSSSSVVSGEVFL